MNNKILVFGCSGTVGLDFINVNKDKDKDILYYSRKKPTIVHKKLWRYIDLNKKITGIPNKVDKIYFLASPYYKLENLKKNIFLKELRWLKKIKNKITKKNFLYGQKLINLMIKNYLKSNHK